MGVVYKAEDTKLKRIVALKLLPAHVSRSPEDKARFLREAQTASSLNHPNITTIYQIDEYQGQMFIAMEYCEGKTLKETIEEETLSIRKVLDIGIQVCEGLNAAHQKDIVHRDIKTENLMVTRDGQVKIMDFGLAKFKGTTTITKTGSTLGTFAYMSPEQACGEEVDQRSDIFSFGIVLYEIITGKLPFLGEHEAAIIYSIVNETQEPLARYKANVPDGLQRVVDKALAKDKEERYQHIDDLLADLRREKKSLEYAKEPFVPKSKRKLLPIMVPSSVIFAIVLLFFIFQPFRFEVGPEKKAVAEENILAIMYFENLVDREDEQKLGEIVTNLLITDLSESRYMNVVSSQRLYDILKLLGREGTKIIDKNVASEVANKAKAKWMLLGSILQIEPQMILTSQLVDVADGKVIASQRIIGESQENIFSMVDKLTVELKEDLSLPAQAQREKDPKVADVTTHSPDAYRFYLEGQDYHSKLYWAEAEKSFSKALDFDTTFAMAYVRLAMLKSGEERNKLIAEAVKYSDRVSQKEKHYIKALSENKKGNFRQALKEMERIIERDPKDKEAFYWIGNYYYNRQNFKKAIYYFNQAVELDPLYKVAYNKLAYAYDKVGDFERSIWAINEYISIAPDEANPYDTKADLYAFNGKLDQAIESYRKAEQIKPEFSLDRLGHMYLFKNDYVKAESCYKELCSSSDKDTRSEGRSYLALIPIYQGKFEGALKVLDHGIAADRMEQAQGVNNASKHFLKANIYEEKKVLNLAVEEVEKALEILHRVNPDYKVYGRDYYVQLLAEKGDFEKAEEVALALRKDIEDSDTTLMWAYRYAAGCIEQKKGDLEGSLYNFERLAQDIPNFFAHYLLARAYLESGRLGEAVAEFERTLSRYDADRALNPTWAVKANYLLGLAYEKSGWNKKAIEKYEEFLDIWKDADPGIEEVEDAKKRIENLKEDNRGV